MSTPLDLLCAGRLYADLVFTGLDAAPEPGREVFAESLMLTAGGGALITAVYGAALGLGAGVFGVLPAPPFDQPVRRVLAEAGVRPHLGLARPGDEPQVTAALVYGGDRAFVTRRPGAALPAMPLPPARHLHIGELATALEHPGLVAEARRAGMTVSLDCGWSEAALARPEAAAIIAAVDLFLPNETEARRLAEHGLAAAPRVATVVKLGARGARFASATATLERPGVPREVVDPTGAGDAFAAGFLAAWLAARPPADCLDAGNACGAAAVAGVGGTGGVVELLGRRGGVARAAGGAP